MAVCKTFGDFTGNSNLNCLYLYAFYLIDVLEKEATVVEVGDLEWTL